LGGGPDHDRKGFRYWKDPGAFNTYIIGKPSSQNSLTHVLTSPLEGDAGRFLAFWSVLTSAVFAFLSTELVGVTIGEAQNPRKAIPRAIKLTFYRILLFYVVLVLLLGMNVPYNSPLLTAANNKSGTAAASPFVVAIKLAGVDVLPSLVNACILVFVFSAANSDLYISSRTLYGLAVEGNAPRIFARTDNRGVPIYSLGLSSAFCLLAFLSVKTATATVFGYFTNLVTIFGLLTWISILISHIYFVRARRAQNVPDTALAYVSPFGVAGSMTALVFACLIAFFKGFDCFVHNPSYGNFDYKDFITAYLGIPLYIIMIFGYKFVMKTKQVGPEEADLFGGKAKIDEDEADFVAAQVRRRGGVAEAKRRKLYRVTLGNLF
jgi:amino acid transporter